MPIATTCPKCQALFRLPDELANRKVKCQKCAALFVAPGAGVDTTTPGMLVASEAEPALSAPMQARSAMPLPPPLPLPTDAPKPPPLPVLIDEEDRNGEADAPPKRSIDRSSSIKRGGKAKSGSSKGALILGVIGLIAIVCVTCVIATWLRGFMGDEKPRRQNLIAKKQGGIPKAIPFREDVVPDLPALDGFKDGKVPPAPPPGPPGSIPVIFGPDGKFVDKNVLTLNDPENKEGKRHKLYVIRMEAGYTYQIDMTSNPQLLDAFLVLRDEKGEFLRQNDDIEFARNQDARLHYSPAETGIFHIEATYCKNPGMDNPTGNYTLTVRHVKEMKQPGKEIERPKDKFK